MHTSTSGTTSAASTAAASAPFFFLFVHTIQNKTSVSKYNRKNQNIYHSLSPSFCFFSQICGITYSQIFRNFWNLMRLIIAARKHLFIIICSILLQSCFKINFKATSNKFQFTLKYILSYQPYSLFIKKNPTYALKAGGIFKFNRLFFTNHHIQNTYSISLPSSEYLPSGL